ncbi:unnamed protein product, partial [Brassica napus]
WNDTKPIFCIILLIFLFDVDQSKSIVMEFQFNPFRLHESRQVDQ